MGIRYPGRAEIDPDNPRAVGVCDRCGQLYNLNRLAPQYQWAGNSLIWLGILVCPRCLDIPSEQLRTIRLPPDPTPVYNARVENFALDEQNFLDIQKPVTALYMLYSQSAVSAELKQDFGVIPSLSATAVLTASLLLGQGLVPFGPALLTEDDEFILTEDDEIITTEADGFGATGSMQVTLT